MAKAERATGTAQAAEKTTVRVWGEVSAEAAQELKIQAIRAGEDYGKFIGGILTRHLGKGGQERSRG